MKQGAYTKYGLNKSKFRYNHSYSSNSIHANIQLIHTKSKQDIGKLQQV